MSKLTAIAVFCGSSPSNDDTIFRIDEYSTEQDYNEEHNITSHYQVYEYDEHDDSEKRKKR